MTGGPVTPLRQRMIEDMTIRQFGAKTQHDYVHVVRDFTRFLGRPPDQAEPAIRAYPLQSEPESGGPPAESCALVQGRGVKFPRRRVFKFERQHCVDSRLGVVSIRNQGCCLWNRTCGAWF